MNSEKQQNGQARPPKTREELSAISLQVWSAALSAKRRVADALEISQYAHVLNHVAPSFFALTQSLLLGDAIVGLCRVTDAPRYRSSERVTIRLLAETTRSAPSLSHIDELIEPLRHVRNNWISHADLKTALAGEVASTRPSHIENAADAVIDWLKEFARVVGLSDSDPVDQGTWKSAELLTACLRDAQAVHGAYVDLLAAFQDPAAARRIDQYLTDQRAAWEEAPFSELEWLEIKRRALREGIAPVLKTLDPDSFYVAILLQADHSNNAADITANWTDRRVDGRVLREAKWLRQELAARSRSETHEIEPA